MPTTTLPNTAAVAIHNSQWPENVRRDLVQSLQSRILNHKFLYDSVRQTQKWLALHRAYSPSQTDSNCAAIYESSFGAVAAACANSDRVHLIGLGCGGGRKDSRLLQLLHRDKKALAYTPCDVSTSMVLVAYQSSLAVVPAADCHPLVCDLLSAANLGELLSLSVAPEATRIVTFFGMIPNFEPQVILPRLVDAVRRDDHLLFSANLAPGSDYHAGVEKILPLYDNELTRDWLLSFLVDLGVERDAGRLRFLVENCPAGMGLKRIAAYFDFHRPCLIEIEEERFQFNVGESIRLFFSYRHTPANICLLLEESGFLVLDRWITQSEEEGVFLCRRKD